MKNWIYWKLYRWVMKLAHRYDWHYAPEHGPFEDGAYQKWCQWCGLRYSYSKPYYTYIVGKDAIVSFKFGQDSTARNSKT